MGTPTESDDVVVSAQGNEPDQLNTPGPNPAWNDVLSVLPESFHNVVTPHFQKWDQAANSRVEAANSALKEFEGYKAFVEHGITPDEVEQGLRLMYEINNNPQNVYTALANAYNFNQTQAVNAGGNGTGEEEDDSSVTDDPRINQLNQQLELVSKIVLADAQAKQEAAADSALEKELSSLREKHGDFDERYVLAMMQNGMTGDQAAEAFKTLQTSFVQQQPIAPSILGNSSGGGSGLPSNAINPADLSSSETRNLVAQMVKLQLGG